MSSEGKGSCSRKQGAWKMFKHTPGRQTIHHKSYVLTTAPLSPYLPVQPEINDTILPE